MISIILPTFNGSKYIKRAIDSVISQTFIEWELFVIDDGSSDDTESIVKKYTDPRIIYLKNEQNLGIQKTLNKGLREAKGEYIARIDDDDIWCDENKLKKQVEFLDKNKDCVLVGTGVVIINEEGNEIMRYLLPEKNEEIRGRLLFKNCFVHSSIVFRKDTALALGGYSEGGEARHIEDYDLWLKLGTGGNFYNLPIYGVKFTSREESLSSKNKIDQFKKDIKLIENFKNDYPNYLKAHIFGMFRLFLYKIFNFIPDSLKNKIVKFYKKN